MKDSDKKKLSDVASSVMGAAIGAYLLDLYIVVPALGREASWISIIAFFVLVDMVLKSIKESRVLNDAAYKDKGDNDGGQ